MTEQRAIREMRVQVLIADLRDINHPMTVKAADALSLMQAELNLAIEINKYIYKQIDRAEESSTK